LRLVLAELLLRRGDNAEIVFGVLEVILGGDRIARTLCVARELQIFLGDVRSSATDLDLGAVGFVNPGQWILPAAAILVVTTAATTTAIVAHALLVLTVSHCRASHQPLICCSIVTSVPVSEICRSVNDAFESQSRYKTRQIWNATYALLSDPAHASLRTIARLTAAPAASRTVPPMGPGSGRSALELGFDLVPQYQAFVHFAISAARLLLPSRLL